MAQLLVTGEARFKGSHTGLVLLQAEQNLIVIDDFSNSEPIALNRLMELADPKAAKPPHFAKRRHL